MSKIVKYIHRRNNKVFFITLEIYDNKQYKLLVDIRERLRNVVSNNIDDHKEIIKIIDSGRMNRKDRLPEDFHNLYSYRSIDYFMYKIGCDLTAKLNVYPEFNNAPFFDRLRLDNKHYHPTTTVSYPTESNMYTFNEEYWMMCDYDMKITVKKIFCVVMTMNAVIESDMKCYNKEDDDDSDDDIVGDEEVIDEKDKTKPDEYLYRIRMLCEDQYPKNKVYQWILKNIITFYCPLIIERLINTHYFPRIICSLITDYVIS